MKLTLGDGKTEIDVPPAVHSAFANWGMGRATEGQQKLCAVWLFRLTQPFGFCPAGASERAAGMAEGARIVGLQIAKLIGGEEPWSLKHLGDVDDDGNDHQDR